MEYFVRGYLKHQWNVSADATSEEFYEAFKNQVWYIFFLSFLLTAFLSRKHNHRDENCVGVTFMNFVFSPSGKYQLANKAACLNDK